MFREDFVKSQSGEPTTELLERCTPRQRRLLGDPGHEFRPGDYFVPPPDHEEVMSGKSGGMRIEQQFEDWHYSPLTDTSPEIITIASKAEIDR